MRVDPVPRNVVTAPLTALNADVAAALAASSTPDTDAVAAGKTWLDINTNYGWLVHADETELNPNDGVRYWHGLKTYATTVPEGRAIQPVSAFHAGQDHVDYSQLGYAVRDA